MDHQSPTSNLLGNEGRASTSPLQPGPATPALPGVTIKMITTLLALSPDALIVVDQDGEIVLANEQLAHLFGYHSDELIGQPLECLLPERLRAIHVSHRAHYAETPHLRPMGQGFSLRGRRKDGSEFPVDISLRPVLLEQTLHTVGAVRDVTAQRLMEQSYAALSEQLHLQGQLIDLARDAILVRDPIGRILSWNRGAEELYGWTAQEATGRVSHILLKTRFPVSRAELDTHLEREGRWEGELTHTRSDGSIMLVESRQVLVRDTRGAPTAILEINRDVTERRKIEQAQLVTYVTTQAQRTFLQELLDALPSSISIAVVHGREARLVLANQAAAGFWGAVWAPGQTMQAFFAAHGIQLVDSQGHPFPSHTWATMRALQKGETVLQQEEVIRQPTGASLPIMVNAVPLTSRSWQSVASQEQHEAPQHENEPLALVIHQDVRLLKEAEYLKDEFVGIAAHELRTPLAVLKGTVSTLLVQTARGHGAPLADWQAELLHELEEGTDRLTKLSEDLLDVTRLQAKQLFLQRAPTNVISLIQRMVNRLQATTTRHQLDVRTELTTLEAYIDPKRTEQMLDNLLTNAIKYSPQGGPISVTVTADEEAHMVEIRVQDTGMGIPQHQHAQIFGRFMRADNARAAGISGTGLGLYLCRMLVEQQDGRLWFASTEGKGTTFFLTLPLVTAW